jgi:hypothetical protein
MCRWSVPQQQRGGPGDNGTISGGVHGNNAANVQLHFVTVNGGIDIHGGAGPFGGPFDITRNTIEDSRVQRRRHYPALRAQTSEGRTLGEGIHALLRHYFLLR